ncbi:MAG: hypothetical protein AAFO81_03760 [Pseudomonadota bacterium]
MSIAASHVPVLHRLLTAVLAALPATALGPMACLAIFYGIVAFDPRISVLYVAWGAGGVFGIAALWSVVFGRYRAWVPVGLLVGIICVTPFSMTYIAVGNRVLSAGPEQLTAMESLLAVGSIALSLSLPAISVAWLIFLARHFRKAGASGDDTLEQ